MKESSQMEQAIVITDVLDYYEKYKSLDLCDSSWNYEETWKILVDDHDTEMYTTLALNASLDYHPRDGTLLLLSLKGKVFCMGVYNAYTSMEQNKIIFYPGTFFLLDPIDYYKKRH